MKLFNYLTLLFLFNYHGIAICQEVPKDFNISFKFGYFKSGEVDFDLKKNILTIAYDDTVKTYERIFSKEENLSIYQELQKINFFNYSENYHYQYSYTENELVVRPCKSYSLTAFNMNTKLVEWNYCIEVKTNDIKYLNLLHLGRFLEQMIWSTDPLSQDPLSIKALKE